MIKEKDLAKLVNKLDEPEVLTEEGKNVWVPSWDKGWLLPALLLFFAMECFLRRRSGLL